MGERSEENQREFATIRVMTVGRIVRIYKACRDPAERDSQAGSPSAESGKMPDFQLRILGSQESVAAPQFVCVD